MSETKATFRVQDLADAIDLTRQRICQLIWSGDIKAVKHGRDWLIPPAEFRRVVRQHERDRDDK